MRGALILALFAAPAFADDFSTRIAEYMKLREKAAASVPRLKPTPSAEQIMSREKALGAKIAELRPNPQQGSIFTPKAAADIRALIAAVMKGSEGTAIRQSLARSAPVKLDLIRVNGPYPTGVPLQTTPPTLLRALPPLPRNIQYRVVNHGLVLYDEEANLIVDFLPDAFSTQ
jgi:hypothetical protein